VLSGEPDVDTEEYDPQVVLHEFGHYLADVFSRSDSVGGQHGFGDVLDMRVAFGEGMRPSSARSCLGDPVYRDSFGVDQGDESYFDLEDDEAIAEGWYSEASTWNSAGISMMEPGFRGQRSAGFGPIWNVMKGPQRDTDAATERVQLRHADENRRQPADATAIATLLVNEQIQGSTIDEFGTTDTNDADSPDVLPVYTPISLGQTDSRNQHQASSERTTSFPIIAFLSMTPCPADERSFHGFRTSGRDADIAIFRRGIWARSRESRTRRRGLHD
jgi:hypothetical protein